MAAIFKMINPNQRMYDLDSNRPGADIEHLPTLSEMLCRKACVDKPNCLSWVFENGECWLKDEIPTRKEQKGPISGVVLEHYVCKK